MFRRLRGIPGGDGIRALEHKVCAGARAGAAETAWRRITALARTYLAGLAQVVHQVSMTA